ncbi:hypothetical protein ACEPAI_4279 [Sanghuangporus weigelae]
MTSLFISKYGVFAIHDSGVPVGSKDDYSTLDIAWIHLVRRCIHPTSATCPSVQYADRPCQQTRLSRVQAF